MAEQFIYIPPLEGLPGFPGGHGPGWYFVDYELRTIRPALQAQAERAEPVEQTAPLAEAPSEENQGG